MSRMAAFAGKKDSFKIGEVCRMADVQPYVLRYWETEFAALAPGKTGGGQRTYTQREIDIILRIKQLLYTEGFTIAGAKKRLETELNSENELATSETAPVAEVSAPPVAAPSSAPTMSTRTRSAIVKATNELRAILALLED
jgi:DNA-binding transcriptional MerR regulator